MVIGYLDDYLFHSRSSNKITVTYKYANGKCKPNDQNSEERHVSDDMQFEFTHSSNTAIVTFTTNTNIEQETKYWGISDFKLTISECPKGCNYCYNSNECSNW